LAFFWPLVLEFGSLLVLFWTRFDPLAETESRSANLAWEWVKMSEMILMVLVFYLLWFYIYIKSKWFCQHVLHSGLIKIMIFF